MVLAINDRCAPDTKKTDVLILLVVATYDTFTTIFNINNINILTPLTLKNSGLSGIRVYLHRSDKLIKFKKSFAWLFSVYLCHEAKLVNRVK